MDIINIFTQFASAHQQLAVGFLCGAVLSNPGTCAIMLFKVAVMVPGVGGWVGRNPEKAKAWMDGFEKAIDDCVDKYAQQQAAAAQPPVPAAKP